jgi:hypothetical protein
VQCGVPVTYPGIGIKCLAEPFKLRKFSGFDTTVRKRGKYFLHGAAGEMDPEKAGGDTANMVILRCTRTEEKDVSIGKKHFLSICMKLHFAAFNVDQLIVFSAIWPVYIGSFQIFAEATVVYLQVSLACLIGIFCPQGKVRRHGGHSFFAMLSQKVTFVHII